MPFIYKTSRPLTNYVVSLIWKCLLVSSMLLCTKAPVRASYSPPTYLRIGAIFTAFEYREKNETNNNRFDVEFAANNIGAQHMAAFRMAIDHINNHSDGIADTILPNTRLEMVVNLGEDFSDNDYLTGSAASFRLHSSGNNLVAIVGGTSIDSTLTSVLTSQLWDYPYILTESTSTELSHKDIYTRVLRMPPSEAFAAYAMFEVLKYFQWKRVTIFHTNDELGVDMMRNFLRESTPNFLKSLRSMSFETNGVNVNLPNLSIFNKDIEVLSLHSLLSSLRDVSEVIEEARPFGAKIFVLFLSKPLTIARILLAGYKQGLFVDDTQVIGFELPRGHLQFHRETNIQANSLWTLIEQLDPSVDVGEVLKGYISVVGDPTLYFGTRNGRKFIERFRALKPTKSVVNNGSQEVCDVRQDNHSNYLYMTPMPSCSCKTSSLLLPTAVTRNNSICTGIKSFTSFLANGSNVHPSVLYTYDAVFSIAEAIHELIRSKAEVNSTNVYKRLTNGNHALASSVTGRVLFSKGESTEGDFGQGDRISGHMFALQMYDYEYHLNSNKHRNVMFGVWNSSHGISSCSDSTHSDYVSCGSLYFRVSASSDVTTPPPDRPDPITKTIPASYRYTLIVLGGIMLLIQLAITCFIGVMWKDKVIRSSQPHLLLLMLLGTMLACIKAILAGYAEINSSICTEDVWLSHVSFTSVFAPLTLKLWRVDKICNNIGIKRIRISEMVVLRYFAGIVSVVVSLLVLISAFGGIQVSYLRNESANQMVEEPICVQGNSMAAVVLKIMLWICQLLILLSSVIFTYRCRNLPPLVNETYLIAPAVVCMVAIIVIVNLIIAVADLNNDKSVLIINLVFILCVYGSCVFYWFPKIKAVQKHAKREEVTRRVVSTSNRSKNQTDGPTPENIEAELNNSDTPQASSSGDASGLVSYIRRSASKVLRTGNDNDNIKAREEEFKRLKQQASSLIEFVGSSVWNSNTKAAFCAEQINIWNATLVLIAETDDSSSGRQQDDSSSIVAESSWRLRSKNSSRVLPESVDLTNESQFEPDSAVLMPQMTLREDAFVENDNESGTSGDCVDDNKEAVVRVQQQAQSLSSTDHGNYKGNDNGSVNVDSQEAEPAAEDIQVAEKV